MKDVKNIEFELSEADRANITYLQECSKQSESDVVGNSIALVRALVEANKLGQKILLESGGNFQKISLDGFIK